MRVVGAVGLVGHAGGDEAEAFIASVRAVVLIEEIEVVDIDHQKGHRLGFAGCALPLSVQDEVEAFTVGNTG